jgi:two-component system capsular synthesis sensor histidine kinase RcsC
VLKIPAFIRKKSDAVADVIVDENKSDVVKYLEDENNTGYVCVFDNGNDIEMASSSSISERSVMEPNPQISTVVRKYNALGKLERADSLGSIFDSGEAMNLAKLSILIVDDVTSTRKIMDRMLHGKIFKSFHAKDGQECVDIVTRGSHKIDIILLDFEMPRMNGPDAAKSLRSMGYTLPIIGVTGNALPEDRAHFISCGANVVVVKPVDMESLIQCMKDVFK